MAVLNAKTLKNMPEADIQGTPIKGKDIHGFKIAASFSQIPMEDWKRLLPGNEFELIKFNPSFYQNPKDNLMGVNLDYSFIDRKNGEYKRVVETFAKSADNNADDFMKTLTRDDYLKQSVVFKHEYPFNNETIKMYIGGVGKGSYEIANLDKEPNDMWQSRKEFFETYVMPCIDEKTIDEKKELVQNSGVLTEPVSIVWKLWLLDQILPREELKTIVSKYDKEELLEHESETAAMKL